MHDIEQVQHEFRARSALLCFNTIGLHNVYGKSGKFIQYTQAYLYIGATTSACNTEIASFLVVFFHVHAVRLHFMDFIISWTLK